MKEYFYKIEYKYMYLGTISYSFANALIGTFGTVMIYKSIWNIYSNINTEYYKRIEGR